MTIEVGSTIEAIDVKVIPAGAIGIFFADPTIDNWTIPDGWLECDGTYLNAVINSEYIYLYNVIGIMYGGTGRNNFRIPDYRGYFLREVDEAAGNDPHRNERGTRGDIAYTIGDFIGTTQTSSIVGHKHKLELDVEESTVGGTEIGFSVGNDTYTSNSGSNEFKPKNINVLYCIRY